MSIQVLFDSQFGNTERIARAIAEGLGEEARFERISEEARIDPGVSLLVIGGPTQAHGTSPAMAAFLGRVPQLDGVAVAAFDTRLTWPRLLSGAASDRIAKVLGQHGARLIVPPESFLVTGKESALVDGETERAVSWAKTVRQALA